MYIYVTIMTCFLIFLIILCISYFSKDKIDSKEIKLYSNLLLVSMFSIIFELLSCYFVYNNDKFYYLALIVNKTFIVSIGVWMYFLTKYIYCISVSTDNKIAAFVSSKSHIIHRVYDILFFIFLTLSVLLPLYFYNKDLIVYSYGPATTVASFEVAFYSISSLICVFVNKKNIISKKYIPLLLFIVIVLIMLIISQYRPDVLFISSTEVLVCIIMYFTIENPDVKMLENMTILRDRADKANNAKSEFLSSMSHEIRTPLNAIVGFSESLKEDQLPEESMDKVDDIIMASNNLLEIVNGILDISKIEANKLEIIEKEYEIEDLWNELIVLTKARIGDRGIDFRVNIDPTIPKVLYGDNTRLKQVILNILTNAAKYTKEGFIDFRVSSVIKDNIVRLIISVEDSGIGIKEESLPRLFSKFDRLSVEKSLTIEGTGLGLAITKKLIELMHGKIVVQSIYGKGSKFTISIDQKIISYEVQHKKETSEASTKVIDINGAKVLLVDDNDLNIKVATTLLKKYNLDIDSCTSGFECLEKINKGNSYDVILLDDMMPKMSGKETLEKLKNIIGFNIPVIALTANAIEGMKEEYLKCGFNDYLSKPIQRDDLERVLRTYISKKNNEDTNSVSSENHTSIISESINLASPDIEVVESTKKKKKKKKKKKNKDTIEQVENNTNNDGYVLVVDDNDLNLKVAKNLIGKYVSKLDTAKSGSEAIEKVITNKYDIIFMDDMMPELDGPTTLDNLYDIDGFNVPTILMTANELNEEIENKITEHKFADYLSKPIDKEKLINILTKYIK